MDRMTTPNYYSRRLLNPISGIVQVLQTGNARAISTDGSNWRIQIQSEILKTPWHELEIPANYDRYFVYGVWSKNNGLTKVPIHPTLYQKHVEQTANALIEMLIQYQDRIPFPQLDHYECWLLDINKLKPVVLINSSVDDNFPDFSRSLDWNPCENHDHTFTTNSFITRQKNATVKIHAKDILNDVVRNITSSPGIAIWVKRDKHGDGHIIANNCKSAPIEKDILRQNEIPLLGITQHWQSDGEQQLVDDYIQWLAPKLLTWSNLDSKTRAELEIAAQQQPLLVDRFYPLYPTVIDKTLLKKILVEAAIRKSSTQASNK
jgi:hypothetical protein